MKKIFTVLIVLLSASAMLFAAEGRIGVSLAPEWLFGGAKVNGEVPEDTGSTSFMLLAEGANYFGKEGGFGIEYGLGVKFPINTWVGDLSTEDESPSAFSLKVGLGYRHEFSDIFGISVGAGALADITKVSEGGEIFGQTISGSSTTFILDIYGSVAADITLIDFLRLEVGAMMGGPVWTATKAQVNAGGLGSWNPDPVKLDYGGFALAPFVRVSFVY